MNGIKVIAKKELTRVFKDKKMIFSLFLFPAILIIGIYSLIGQLTSTMMNDIDTHSATVYVINAPKEVKTFIEESDFAKNAKITYVQEADKSTMEGLQTKIKDEDLDLVISFSPQFFQTFEAYQTKGDLIPTVDVYYTNTGDYSSYAKNEFEDAILHPFELQLQEKRIGDLERLEVFSTNTQAIDKENAAMGEMLAMMMPYFITMMLFAGAMSLGVDAIAGEKERGTMATLLITPIPRSQIAIGKILGLSILSSLSAIMYASAMIISIPNMLKSVAGNNMLGKIDFSAEQVITLLFIMIGMVFLYVAMISIVSIYASSVKEAQSYVSPIYIVVILAGMLTMFQSGKEQALYAYAIPLYGNALAIQKIVTNELLPSQFFLSFGGTVLLAMLLVFGITKAFNSEKVMFHA